MRGYKIVIYLIVTYIMVFMRPDEQWYMSRYYEAHRTMPIHWTDFKE